MHSHRKTRSFSIRLSQPVIASATIMLLLLGGCVTTPQAQGPIQVANLPWPKKVVQIQWCLVDDGRNTGPTPAASRNPAINPGAPDDRFSAITRALGLWAKSREFAAANIDFVNAGRVLIIDDPHPNYRPWRAGGERGDLADPGGGQREEESFSSGGANTPVTPAEQFDAVQRACLAHPNYVPGLLLEIVIRRFVSATDNDGDNRYDENTIPSARDYDGDGLRQEDLIEKAGLWGVSPQPPCSTEPTPLQTTPMVIDPENFPGFLNFMNFGNTLAHENGHALCLGHRAGGLMSPTAPPFLSGLNAREIGLLRAQAQHETRTRDKNSSGIVIARTGPVNAYALDAVADAEPSVDIFAAGSSVRADRSLGLLIELSNPLELSGNSGKAVFTIDVDGDAATGIGTDTLPGADLELALMISDGQDSIDYEAQLRVAAADGQGPQEWQTVDAQTLVRIEPILLDDVPIAYIVHAVVPGEFADVGPTYRVAASFSVGPLSDSAPIIDGSSTPFDYSAGPTITIEPLTVSAEVGSVVVTGQAYSPGSTAMVVAGRTRLDDVAVGEDGAFEITISYPDLASGQSVAFPDGQGATHVRVYDEIVGGDAMTVTLGR